MHQLTQTFLRIFYKPFLTFYLKKERSWKFKNIYIKVLPGVFHPRFFYSTKLMLNYINTLPLKDKNILEPGAGSGLTAIFCAKSNASITATDINKTAIENIKINAALNDVSMNIIYSDLFENIPVQVFDYILINPPYYRQKPITDEQYAWYCGENGEYFERLFKSVPAYISDQSIILMVLSEDCDIEMIRNKAIENKLSFTEIVKKTIWFETNYIFSMQINVFRP